MLDGVESVICINISIVYAIQDLRDSLSLQTLLLLKLNRLDTLVADPPPSNLTTGTDSHILHPFLVDRQIPEDQEAFIPILLEHG